MNCDLCREPILFSAQSFYKLIITEDTSEGDDAEEFDFCSWRCLKHWVIDE